MATVLFEKMHAFEAAAKSFQQALMLEPNDFFSHMFLGLSQLAREQFAAAQASFLAARAIRPDFQYINLFLGVCAGKLGEKEEAEKLFDDSRYSEDARVALLVNRGVVHYDSGDNAKAIADFEAALRRFNKKVQQAGILAESRRREAFENAAEKKKRKDAKRKKPMGGGPRGI